jgi:ElaB/YqjD/DUF883 family membrane-anchored ribosome-binding protein
MGTQIQTSNEFKLIQEEASRVMADLSHLGKFLADVTKKESQNMKEDISGAIQEELHSLKKRIRTVNSQIIEQGKAADLKIHANPYPYILGSLGVGLLLGKMLPRTHAE